MLDAIKIENTPISSNCYVVYETSSSSRCIIIDPGSEDNSALYAILANNGLKPEYIFLTHEHFDHCLGVNSLREMFPKVKLICSKSCNMAIQNEKKNCSIFWDNTKGFVIAPADILIEDIAHRIEWDGKFVEFISTPGHTPGSYSFLIGKYLFTGDAYIPGIKTVTKLPGGNKQQAAQSEAQIKAIIASRGVIVCPGHPTAEN